jgi:hypothetical protein
MDPIYGLLGISLLVAIVYVLRLLIRERGDFEAGGRSGRFEFFLKAKQRK